MASMNAEIYDAFRAANVPEDKARAAATAVAAHDNQFAKVESELQIIKWMLGFSLALNVAILIRLFVH